MTKLQKLSLFLLRISMGWLMLYAGISKIIKPGWTAAGYLGSAKTLPSLYAWFAGPGILSVVNFLNEWGAVLIGISLILGILVRVSSIFGIILMILYYLPVLQFPYVGANSYIIDQHVIYIITFAVLAAFDAGRTFGLDAKIFKN